MRPARTGRLIAVWGALVISSLLASAASHAAETYPSRPVRIIVPLAAGGGMDGIARSLGQQLGEIFGQTVVVDNRPGAGSQVGLDILASSAPDGYTVMMISATTVIHPLLYGSRHDILRDFTPISQVTQQGYAQVIHPSIPAKTVAQFVEYLKAHPGEINFASSGIGSPIHMTGELFQIATGTKMTHVPFKGMGAAYTDLIAGRIQSAFATVISSLPHVKAGRLRALAVTTPKRVAIMPDVPTLTEAGVPVTVVNWYGLIGPKGLPRAIVEKLATEVGKVMHSPVTAKQLAGEGSEPVGSTPPEFAAHLRAEGDQWNKVITQAGIRQKVKGPAR